ncbi:hypothetical protein SAMN05421740_110129 [Parapedobacter koreensis]|uniref:Uncharacterized protein n=1 Tax=Parapedobacter koreensis TaxID=332977 RepID=A0A1H7T9X0_9SPHI|nr:hypothetical protein SAMN05421740_110129 [Parapedobacter koreensis]
MKRVFCFYLQLLFPPTIPFLPPSPVRDAGLIRGVSVKNPDPHRIRAG